MSDVVVIDPKCYRPEQAAAVDAVEPAPVEEERPPICPRCHKRLVILSTQWTRDVSGVAVRRQLWGCPRGHAMAFHVNGSFGQIEQLPDIVR